MGVTAVIVSIERCADMHCKMITKDKIVGALLGHCIGDALGVPVEFQSRHTLREKPVSDMLSGGSHGQPAGTWSDDSSLMLCTTEVFVRGFSYVDVAKNFIEWFEKGYWSARGEVFDIGNTTKRAIIELERLLLIENKHDKILDAGLSDENHCGNGSLMRILPAAIWRCRLKIEEGFELVHNLSKLTHAHPRCLIACGIFSQIVVEVINGKTKEKAYLEGITLSKSFYERQKVFREELKHFEKILNGTLHKTPEFHIHSTGYVIHTLEAALWCFLTTSSFRDAVLKAVNLGEDTDTTAAVTGGLAGLYYGLKDIPENWINTIARKDDIISLANEFYTALNSTI